jgi:AcrR family transcriptional regulator
VPEKSRPIRADAAANRAQILVAARAVFTERGGRTSLNEVVRRAGVGPGTLYRHFPDLQALLVALIQEDVDDLCAYGRRLATAADPDEALRQWLRAFVLHTSRMRGLPAEHLAMSSDPEQLNNLSALHDAILKIGAELLERCRRPGSRSAPGPDVRDLLRLASAIAWAGQQAPDDEELTDRLLALVTL